ncbi:hypothetical protein C8Q73DRAFT_224768 [Cubamyces lactineus]|nr:hypothetical protein C8Q73DRAFT_224768 [Cubamyces lactineus]
MTSTRAPVPPVDLKARIAAFQEQQKAANAKQNTSSSSAVLPKPSAASGNTNLRDRIASFEKQGAVPAPKSRFGFAPIPQQDEPAPLKRHGELYGNRIPGLSRPHIPVPSSNKGDKRSSSRPRESTRLELERYVTSPSPPHSPFLTSDNGDSIGEVLSDGELTSPGDPSGASQEEAQLSLAALVSPPISEGEHSLQSPPADGDSSPKPDTSIEEDNASHTAEQTDTGAAPADEEMQPPSVVVSPSEPVEVLSSAGNAEDSPSAVDVNKEHEGGSLSASGQAIATEQTDVLSEPHPAAQREPIDPAVQAVIDQLDKATQSGDAGAVIVPAEALQTLVQLGTEQQKSVQDMLDQLLLQQDAIDIATPIKQRFSLNGQLSSQAVLDYISQQSSLSKDANPSTPPRNVGKVHKDTQDETPQLQSNQFLSPTTPSTYSADSPVGEEPLSPASDIYSAYYAATPAVSERPPRALPAIPEAPDSPALFKAARRGTFGADGDVLSAGSSAPTSAPVRTPSDDGLFSEQQSSVGDKRDTQRSVTPGDGMVRIAGTPPRVTSPPLSVVIPQPAAPKPVQAPPKIKEPQASDVIDAVIVHEPRNVVSPVVARGIVVPAPKSASGSSSSSPASTYSPNSTYSGDGTSPSSTAPVSRKASSASRGRRSHVVSPVPPSAPFEEPELTPIEGPKGFRAVVHRKVVEGKSRPVSVNVQYPDLPSPSPMVGTGMSDLAALLADAVVFEKQLADVRTPSKKPRTAPAPAPAPPVSSTPTPPPGTGRGGSDRPRPSQDLPESPEDHDQFARLSQSQERNASAPRTSHTSGRPLPEHPRLSRPSVDRTIDRKPSRPSLERMPSRPSLDQAASARPSTDSTSSRIQLQPMFLTADPNAVRIPLPPRPKSAMAHSSSASRSQSSTPPPPLPPKSPPRTGYLTNLLSRAKSSSSLRPSPDPRDSLGSSSEDSVMVATPPTPPYDTGSINESTGSIRSSRMFKNGLSRVSTLADRMLHRKDGSNQGPEVAIASGDDEDGQSGSQRALPRPPRPLPLPPQPQPPRGLPPPVPNPNNLAPVPQQPQPQLSRRASWKSIASVSTTGISEALDNAGLFESFPSVPDNVPRAPPGLPAGPAAYTSPRPAPLPPLPPPNQPLPPPPSQPLPPPPRGASHGAMVIPPGGRPGLPANPASRPKTLPSRPKVPPQQLRSGMI